MIIQNTLNWNIDYNISFSLEDLMTDTIFITNEFVQKPTEIVRLESIIVSPDGNNLFLTTYQSGVVVFNLSTMDGKLLYEPKLQFSHPYVCSDGFVIPKEFVNNGISYCPLGDDEQKYDVNDNPINFYQCAEDEIFILISQVNDGIVDCNGGDDEVRSNPILMENVSVFTP